MIMIRVRVLSKGMGVFPSRVTCLTLVVYGQKRACRDRYVSNGLNVRQTARSLSDFGIVRLQTDRDGPFFTGFLPHRMTMRRRIRQKLARRGRFSLSTTKVRQAPRRLRCCFV